MAKEKKIVQAKSKEIKIGPGNRHVFVLRVGESGEMRTIPVTTRSAKDEDASESQLIRRAAKQRRDSPHQSSEVGGHLSRGVYVMFLSASILFFYDVFSMIYPSAIWV